MKLYIAGPMTGLPLYNFPAFFEAERDLRAAGHDVVNPAQVDINEGDVIMRGHLTPLDIRSVTLAPSFNLDRVMARDLALIDECDGVYLLNGWAESVGARRELDHAVTFCIPVFNEFDGIPPLEDEQPAARWIDDDDANPKDIAGRSKPQMHLVPPVALVRMAAVMELGASKYDPYNWRAKAVGYSAYVSAAMRHLAAAYDGEDLDPESGQPHLAHVAACMAILLDADACGALIDDRPTAGAAGDLIREMTT